VLTDETVLRKASLCLPQAAAIGRSLGLDGVLDIDEIARSEP
jgi:hypothetical protein